MSQPEAQPLPPLQIPFTPEGMAMVSSILEGLSRVAEKQAKEIEHLQKSADGQKTGGQS